MVDEQGHLHNEWAPTVDCRLDSRNGAVFGKNPLKLLDRYRGALLGLAAGDALGTTLEFTPPGTFDADHRHGRRRPVRPASRASGRTTRRWRCASPRASSSAAASTRSTSCRRYVRW